MKKLLAIFALATLAGCAAPPANPTASLDPHDFVEKYGENGVPPGFRTETDFRVFPGDIALFEVHLNDAAQRRTIAWHGPSGEFRHFAFRLGGKVATEGGGRHSVSLDECAATPTCEPFGDLIISRTAGGMDEKISLPDQKIWSDEKILEYFQNNFLKK